MEVEIAAEFGYVVLVAILSTFVIMWMGFKVGSARKQYGVKVSVIKIVALLTAREQITFIHCTTAWRQSICKRIRKRIIESMHAQTYMSRLETLRYIVLRK